MIGLLMRYVTGPAAKAGAALIGGALSALGGSVAVGGLPQLDPAAPEGQLTLIGYVLVGALGGAINWALVYFKRNKD